MAHHAHWAPFKRAAFAAFVAAAFFGSQFKAAAADDYPNRVVAVDRAVPARRRRRHRRPRHRAEAHRGARPAGHRGQQAGRRLGDRRARRRQGGARRLHHPDAGHRSKPARQHRLRSREGLHANRADRLDPDRDHGQSVGAGEIHVGHRRAREEEAGHAHSRHAAGADAQLFRRRSVQGHGRRRHDHRHLQGHRPADHRSARRARDGRRSTRCRRRSATSRPARSALSRWLRRNGWRRCPTCRPPSNPACRGSTSCSITGWSRRPVRPSRSSRGSTRSCARS